MADFAWVTHAAGQRKGQRKYVNLDKVVDMVRGEDGDLTAVFLDASAARQPRSPEEWQKERHRDDRLVLCVETPEQICKQRI